MKIHGRKKSKNVIDETDPVKSKIVRDNWQRNFDSQIKADKDVVRKMVDKKPLKEQQDLKTRVVNFVNNNNKKSQPKAAKNNRQLKETHSPQKGFGYLPIKSDKFEKD